MAAGPLFGILVPDAKGHLNAASWHGGAAVFSTNTASGKWTLQMLEQKWDRPGIQAITPKVVHV